MLRALVSYAKKKKVAVVVNDCFVYEEWIRGHKHERGVDGSWGTVVVLARDNSRLD